MIFSTSSLLNIFFLPAKLGKFYKDLNTCFTVCLQCKCDQNPDLGNAHCKPAADGDEKKGLKRQWSFSGLATMVRITLMYYIDFFSLFNNPEKEWEIILAEASGAPPGASLFD